MRLPTAVLRTLSTVLLAPVLVLALVGGLAGGAASTAAAAAPSARVPGAAAQSYAQDAHRETNRQRAAHDVRALGFNSCLTNLAKQQAKKMANRGELFHQDLHRVMNRCGLDRAGENVAAGFRNGTQVVRYGWMKSQGHRENLLAPRYRLEGVAAVKKGGTWYVAQVFGRKA